MSRLIVSPGRLKQAVLRRIVRHSTAGEIDWEERATQLGARSVIDMRHAPGEYDYVTEMQKKIIFPYLKEALHGNETTILDFGCGVGRFTADLARMIQGNALGFDPTRKLIELCRPTGNTGFTSDDGFLETLSAEFDAIWICLVLGGIAENNLARLAGKIEKKLKTGGLLFFVESTGKRTVEGPWRVRTVARYERLFPSVSVQRIGGYYDAGQEISIFAGRKTQDAPHR